MDWTDTWKERGDSFNYAMSLFPDARNKERDLLIQALDIRLPHKLLEVAPSGSAFLSEGLRDVLGRDFSCRAIEPASVFAERLPKYIEVIAGATFDDFKMPDATFDRIANLTGLHHSSESVLQGFFKEAYRSLKPGGRLGVADVRKGSLVDAWLNRFVDEHNPKGHSGRFFEQGELSKFLSAEGFVEIEETTECYSWDFPSVESMVTFCKHMFYIQGLSDQSMLDGIKEYLGFDLHPGGNVSMYWELIYCFGNKPEACSA